MDPSDDEEWESLVQPPDSGAAAAATTKTGEPHHLHDAASNINNNNNNKPSSGSVASPSPAFSAAETLALAVSSSRASRSNQDRMMIVHEKLESRRQVKDKLVNHPVQMLWSRFIGYLLRELWELDTRIRLALALILLGVITKLVLVSTAFVWYPRFFIVPSLIIVPFLYLNPSYIPVTLNRAIHALQSPTNLADSLSRIDPTSLRRLCCIALFLPTLLEVRTIQFLSQIKIDAGWTLYNFLVAALIAAAMWSAHVRFGKSARECTHIGFVCLYGSALVVTLVQLDVWRIPILMAPFCLATGILLLHSVDDNYEWCTRAIHHSLRLALRDALTIVSESVSEDEMLQLAMLRWIVDYWGSTPSPTAESASREQTRTPSSPSSSSSSPSTNAPRVNEVSLVTVPHERELTWSELLPMLTMTSEQIRTEVDMLQSRSDLPAGSSSSYNEPQSSRTESSSFSPRSVIDLQTMLASMDLDDRAKPAVMAYKQAVQSFPPSRETAILLSVARRCPALLALLWELVVSRAGTFSSAVILLPFVVVELIRCKRWSESCKRAATYGNSEEVGTNEALFLEKVDPVVILLSGDQLSLHRPPTLLGVWMNVVSSVSALEMGLTAARCVQTTAVAIDFAQNIMSLAEFGFEVASRGWIHGASLLAKELVIHHTRLYSNASGGPRTKYTNAALKVVANSQKMSRNVQELMEDENSRHVLNPVVGFLSVAVGRGWLWGKDPVPVMPPSSVVIEELDPDSEEASDVFGQSLRSRLEPEVKDTRVVMPDVSEIMDLIAATSSRNLISQHEKNNLCERLLDMQAGNSAPDLSWIEATKRTLEGLILIDDRAEDSVVTVLTTETSGAVTKKVGDSGVDKPEGEIILSDLISESRHVERPNDVVQTQREQIEHLPTGSTDTMPSDEVRKDDESAEYEPLSPDDALAIKSSELVGHDVGATMNMQQQTWSDQASGDNIWVQIGGGLAVVGAVVGVAALALQNNGDGSRRRQSRRDNQTQPSQ